MALSLGGLYLAAAQRRGLENAFMTEDGFVVGLLVAIRTVLPEGRIGLFVLTHWFTVPSDPRPSAVTKRAVQVRWLADVRTESGYLNYTATI